MMLFLVGVPAAASMIVAAFIHASMAAAQFHRPPEYAAHPTLALQQVKACGFEQARLEQDRDLQEEIVVVSGVKVASDAQLECVAKAGLGAITFVVFDEALNERFQKIADRVGDDLARQDARNWLSERGLLSRLPNYQAGAIDDLSFAQKLEALCGPGAQGAFIRDRGMVTLKMGTPDKPAIDEKTFVCLANAANAAGFPLGFPGKEYIILNVKKPSRE